MESKLTLWCLFLYLLLLQSQKGLAQSPCKPPQGRPNCVCNTPKGLIDITSIVNNNGKPRYTNLKDPNDYTYEFNPCYGFGYGTSGCHSNTAACQNEKSDPKTQYNCGAANTETFMYNPNGDNLLEYTGGEGARTTTVTLHCTQDKTPRITTMGDSKPGEIFHYYFDIYSVCACPGGCKPAYVSSGSGGNDAGAIGLVLIFVVIGVLVTYFIVGAIILKFKFEKSGTDIIPQKAFWFALPCMIKDGFLFTFTPIIRLFKKDFQGLGYEKL